MWTELKAKAAAVADRHMLELFEADPDRADRFSAQTGDMRLDYSKTNLDDDTRDQLLALADAAYWQAKRDAILRARRSTRPRGGPSCTPLCAIWTAARSWLTART